MYCKFEREKNGLVPPGCASVHVSGQVRARVRKTQRRQRCPSDHGDVVITYGRYVGRFKNAVPGRTEFTVWYQRVYANRGGRWQYLSHRTVDGPVYKEQ